MPDFNTRETWSEARERMNAVLHPYGLHVDSEDPWHAAPWDLYRIEAGRLEYVPASLPERRYPDGYPHVNFPLDTQPAQIIGWVRRHLEEVNA